MIDINNISKIGIGTWGIGGYMERDDSLDLTKQIHAIEYQLLKGVNLVQANSMYSQGLALDMLGKAINNSKINRENLFIINANYLTNKNLSNINEDIDRVIKQLNTNYVDTFQFRSKAFYDNTFDDCCLAVDQLLKSGKTRFTSITNPSLDLLQKYHKKFGDRLFSVEINHNFEIRSNEKAGIIDYAQKNNIKIIIYQPLRRNRTANRNWTLLKLLSEKYKVSQNQIILSWLLSKGFYLLTKSDSISHIDENLESCNLSILNDDLQLIEQFVPPNYIVPQIDWEWSGKGVTVDQLSNIFDENYDKQTH